MTEDLQKLIKETDHLASLVLPRLQGLETFGSGSTIHAVAGFISIINFYHDRLETEATAEYANKYREWVDHADRWLTKLAKQL